MPNTITVSGNTAKRGAEVRFSQGGAAFANFSVAGTCSRFDKQRGEYVDLGEPLWFNVVARFELAEQVGEQLPEGTSRRVTVTGHLEQSSYTTRGGEQRTGLQLVADSVCVHPERRRQGGQGQQRPQQDQGDPWAAPQGQRQGGWQPSYDPSAPPF